MHLNYINSNNYLYYSNYLYNKYNKYNYYNSKKYKLKQIRYNRQQLKQIKNIYDCIKFLKFLYKNNNCTDNLINNIYILYLYEPPLDTEIQTLSILQQEYQDTFNIEEYSIMTLWCCTIYYIENLPKIKRQKTWP